MNINDLKLYGDELTEPLLVLFKKTGNKSISGYLGEEFNDLLFDDDGKIHFSTIKNADGMKIDSHVVLLDNSILIKQTQKGNYSSSYRLYSWDIDNDRYTYISFDNPIALNRYYDTIKRFDISLCGEDISSLFQEMGLTFESINQILLNQSIDPMEVLFDEDNKPLKI